jgi:hypothetical protein
MSLIPKEESGSESGLEILSNLFIVNNLAERVGFEFTRKRSFNNMGRTAGTVKRWKTVVSSANGSQTDHGSVIALRFHDKTYQRNTSSNSGALVPNQCRWSSLSQADRMAYFSALLIRIDRGRLVGVRSRFRLNSYDINRLARKQSPHG